MTKPYFPVPATDDHFEIGPFKWGKNYGEGQTAGIRIQAGGVGVYNVIRPRWPSAINDGISFQVQARIRSQLQIAQGAGQGFTVQVRALKIVGESQSMVYHNRPDLNTELWYTRTGGEFELLTSVCHIPPGSGATHLLVEPQVHAPSGFVDITSVRVRSFYNQLVEYQINGPLTAYVNNVNTFDRQIRVTPLLVVKGQEMQVDLSFVTNADFSMFVVSAKLVMRAVDGGTDNYGISGSTVSQATDNEINRTATFVADRTYNQMTLEFSFLDFSNRTGNWTLKNIDFRLNKKDVIRSGF